MAGEQINIASENEINISACSDGGVGQSGQINITADILRLRQKYNGQVLVESNLGVSQNVIIGGGMHIEGEVTLNHVTAPCEIQETETTTLYGKPQSVRIGTCVITGSHGADGHWPVYGFGAVENSLKMYDHTHNFKNLPLHLVKTSDDLRKVGKQCEKTTPIGPAPVEHENKGGGLGQAGESL
jgi:hypothetical protein